jgi:hypothetical protein
MQAPAPDPRAAELRQRLVVILSKLEEARTAGNSTLDQQVAEYEAWRKEYNAWLKSAAKI